MQPFQYPSNLYPFPGKSITIDSNRVHYIDEGRGKVILFCHPPVTSSFMYRHMIGTLSKSFRCVALDFPGFGLSEAPDGYVPSIASQAAIFEQLIEKLQLTDIYLLMQEVGGHAAFSVLMKKPHLLRGLIVTDTIVFPCSAYPRIDRMLRLVNGRFFNLINTRFNFIVRAMTRFGIRKRKLSPEERNTYKAMFNTREKRRNITGMLFELINQEPLLQAIQQALETKFNTLPVLILYGSEDPLTQMEIPQRLEKMLPNSELHWIKGEAHFPHEGAPDEMSASIAAWLHKQ